MACVSTFIPGDKPTDLAPFIYTPLGFSEHTRTLRLEPSIDPKAPLRCSLQPVDLDTYPDYEALSYTWGLPDFTESLAVEQSGHCFHLKITPNLHHGLQRLRLAATARYLWVDAVCIDQSDGKDKAKQIPRMAQIYRQANNVIIWLGEHPAEAKCLARLSTAVTRPHEELQLAQIRKDCEGLYSVPWFRRRWIIQEAVLNDDVIILCGDSSTSLTRVIHAFTKFEHSFPIIQKIAELRRGRIWNQPISNEIVTLLESFGEAECSNDLDQLYAIAGLSGDVEPVMMEDQRQEHLSTRTPKVILPVNYEQDAKSFYGSFAKALLKHYEAMSPVTKMLSSAFADILCKGNFHQIVTYKKHDVAADTSRGPAPGETWLRIADLSTPSPAGCTASKLCTWIQSVFRDVMKWAQAVQGKGRYRMHTDFFFLVTLFGVMTDWHPPNLSSESDEPDAQGLMNFKSICMGTKSITEFSLTQSPLREISRTMRSRRVVKWESYLMKYSGAGGDGSPQSAMLADADLDNLAQRLNHDGQVRPPTTRFRIGIAPDFADIHDELMVGPREIVGSAYIDMSGDSTLGWALKRGFVLRLSHERCDYGHKEVQHYNFIGECAVADDCAFEYWEHERRKYSKTTNFDMCLH